ncbi:MAG: lamin tail domain-containing protein [Verrucomicrobiota bacterium]
MNNSAKVLISAFSILATTASAQLVITEVMSNSDHPGGDANGDWWELTNTGGSAVDLTDYYWDDGDGFGVDGAVFPSVNIGAGESIVIVDEGTDNLAGFIAAWGGGFTAISRDDFGGDNDFSGLSAGGDQVDLYNSAGGIVDSAVFGDSDGGGKSFEWDSSGTSLGFSVQGENGAFIAPGDGAGGTGIDIGSPGVIPEPGIFGALAGVVALGFAASRRRIRHN